MAWAGEIANAMRSATRTTIVRPRCIEPSRPVSKHFSCELPASLSTPSWKTKKLDRAGAERARPGPTDRLAETAAAQPEQSGQQGAGQRDKHDDAGDHHGLLELALGHVVELQDRERTVGAGGQQREVADVARCPDEGDHAHREQGGGHEAQDYSPIGCPPRRARDPRGFLELAP